MPWSSGDSLSPSNLNRKSGVVFNVKEYGAVGNGSTNDTTAFATALSAATRGDTVFVPSTQSGYVLTSTVTVPESVTLAGAARGLRSSQWVDGVGLNSTTSGRGTQLRLSNKTDAAIVLLDDAAVENFTFFYPGQSWGLTSVSSSWQTYATTIQLGVSGAAVFTPAVRGCHFLGATIGISQGDTTGNAVNSAQIENCSGVVTQWFANLRLVSDPVRVNNISLNPVYATAFVTDSTVNGSSTAFYTKVAQTAVMLHLGGVSDLFASDLYGFGLRHLAHWNNDQFTGDGNEECGGHFTNIVADSCYQAFRIDRKNNVTPLNVTNARFAPLIRPTGASSDGSHQAVLSLRSSTQSFRASFVNFRSHGSNLASFEAGYSGNADHAFVADAGLLTPNSIIVNVDNAFFDNLGRSVTDSSMSGVVRFGKYCNADIPQAQRWDALLSLLSAVALPSTQTGLGYMYADSGTSLYWVNGSGVSTLMV